jgi:hypothetical protein
MQGKPNEAVWKSICQTCKALSEEPVNNGHRAQAGNRKRR